MAPKSSLNIIFCIAVATWVTILAIQGLPIEKALLEPASKVLFIVTLTITAFEKWLWRIIPFLYPRVVRIPNIRGTYKGLIISSWVNANDQPIDPIEAYLSICQTLTSIQIRLFTKASQSSSLLGYFIKANDDQQELIFTYRNEPSIEQRHKTSNIHYGTAFVKIILNKSDIELKGEYWTERKTNGSLNFKLITRKNCYSFDGCKNISS